MALALLRFIVLLFVLAFLLYLFARVSRRLGGTPRRVKETQDPYAVLGVSRGASEAEIKDAYHRELAKYHPDKVAHLGEDLQKLAQLKTTEIIEAYRQLCRKA